MSDEKVIVTIDADLEDLVPGFLENRSGDCVKLAAALADNDMQSIQSIGHNLKGLGGGYGFEKISEIGAALETAAKAGDMENISPLIGQLENYLENIEVKFE